MLTALIALQSAVLIVLGWRLTRAKPTAARRARFPLLRIASALIVQSALMLVIVNAVGSAFPGGVPAAESSRLLWAGLTVWGTQAVRLLLLVLAMSAWMRIVVADPTDRRFSPRHPTTLLAVSLGVEALQRGGTGVPLIASSIPLVLLFVLLPMEWAKAYRGARRFLLFFGALVGFCFSQELIVTSARMGEQGNLVSMFNAPQLPLVGGATAEPFAAAVRAAAPLTVATRVILNIFALQALALMFRLGLPRLDLPAFGLRTMSLKRRFAMTYVLIRLVPSLISLAILVAACYFLIGVGKVSRATEAIHGVMERGAGAAGRVLEETAALSPAPRAARDAGAVARILSVARESMGQDTAQTHLVFRAIETIAASADSESSRGGTAGRATVTATPGTPADLVALPYAADWTRSAARGLVAAGGRLYVHTSAARRADSARAEIAEVYVAIDSLFVSRIARAAGADASIATRPGTLVRRGPEGLTLGPAGTSGAAARRLAAASDPAHALGRGPIDIEPADSTWALSKIEVSAPQPDDGVKRPNGDPARYLAKDVLPIGDWTTAEVVPHGAVAITLRSTLPRILRGLYAIVIPLLVTIGTPVVLLAAGLLLFAEGLAVRAGRGIAGAILVDVGEITSAARRIGEGDLMHRVPVRGRDELSKLGTTLNEMAANLKRHQEELIEKERLEADLAVAREIQQRLLPQRPPAVAGLDVAGVSIPSREVGGDLFAFLPLEGGRLGIALGDVSGKSVPAALLMSNALAALKAQVQHATPVDESLANVNRLICEDVEPGRFVTLFFGVIDPAAGEIRHASAGHNPPLVTSVSGEERWLVEGGVPLGVDPEAEYPSAVTRLARGDVLVIYSDGVTEAEGPPDSSAPDEPVMFGEERVAAAVRALRGHSAAEIVEGIVAAVRTFAGGVPQGDDLTLVVIRVC